MPKPFEILTTDQLLKRLDSYKYKQLHVHHTWKPNHKNFTGKNHLALQEGMYNYHTKTNGWGDIGQHVTLMPDGRWVTGRAFNSTPASIKGWNTGAFAVEMLGDFDIGQDKLQCAQKESILELARYFSKRFGEKSIVFHREGPNVTKTCPGSGISKADFLEEVRNVGKLYKDVPDDRWSIKHLEAADKLNFVNPDAEGNFRPKDPLTREEAAVIAVRIYEATTGKKVV